jgi:lysophospholipase L1-like esterase
METTMKTGYCWRNVAASFAVLVLLASSAALGGEALARLTAEGTPLRKGERISFIGDSITMQGGFVRAIEKQLAASDATKDLGVRVFQHGLNGGRVDTIVGGKTPWGKQLPYAELLKQDQPTVVVLYLGVNDAEQGKTTVEEFQKGLSQLVADAKAAGATVVLLTPAVAGEQTEATSRSAKLDEFAARSRQVAEAQHVVLCDVRAAFVDYLREHNTDNKSRGLLTYDGIHMSDAGNALLAETIAKSLAAALAARGE